MEEPEKERSSSPLPPMADQEQEPLVNKSIVAKTTVRSLIACGKSAV